MTKHIQARLPASVLALLILFAEVGWSQKAERPLPGDDAPPATLRGIYMGQEYQKIIGPILTQSGISKTSLVFWEDGRVARDPVIEGPDRFNYGSLSAESRGQYRLNGNTVQITWGEGSKVSIPMAEDGSVRLYGTVYYPLPTCDGLTLSGVYGLDWSNPYVEHRVIRFHPNGAFEDEGVLGQTALSVAQKYLGIEPPWNPPAGNGRYRIHFNTLYLKYQSGHEETVGILVAPSYVQRGDFPVIELAGYKFERKGDNPGDRIDDPGFTDGIDKGTAQLDGGGETGNAESGVVHATTSLLTGVRLPGEAMRTTDEKALANSTQVLQNLLVQANVKVTEVEVLVWTPPGYEQAEAGNLISQVAQALQRAGYTYVQKDVSKTQEYSAVQLTASNFQTGKTIFGWWWIRRDFLALQWCRVLPGK